MEISQSEARQALDNIEDTAARARKMIAYGGGDVLFVIWGIIWVLGYCASQFIPNQSGAIWLALLASGIALSVVIGKRAIPVRSPMDRRIGWFWFLLYMYVSLWTSLLMPFVQVNGREQSQMFWRHWGAIMATIPMFAYVVTGLWLDHFMLWIGLGVTALTLLGLWLVQPYFFLWMALTGGGTLICTGLLIHGRWR